MRSLTQIKNQYSAELGELELRCENAKTTIENTSYSYNESPRNWRRDSHENNLQRQKERKMEQEASLNAQKKLALYQLNIRTLYYGYKDFLQTKDVNEDGYLIFFRELVAKGAPVEPIICAAIAAESKAIEKTCKDWNSNVNKALAFAVLEYLTQFSRLENEKWINIIKAILSQGADPNFIFDSHHINLVIQKKNYIWLTPESQIRSAFHMLLFCNTEYYGREGKLVHLDLVNAFTSHQKSERYQRLYLDTDQVMKLYAVALKNSPRLTDNPWIKWLEQNASEFKYAVTQNCTQLIHDLASLNEYTSIDYLRTEYNINPFLHLIDKEFNIYIRSTTSWIETASFRYLDKHLSKELQEHIKQNHDTIIQRFPAYRLASELKYDILDDYRIRYNLNFCVLLLMEAKQKNADDFYLSTDPLFRYLKNKDLNTLKKFIQQNHNTIVPLFGFKKLLLQKEYKLASSLIEEFNLEPFQYLIEALHAQNAKPWFSGGIFDFIEKNYLKNLKEYLLNNFDNLTKKFASTNDLYSLEWISKIKLISKEVILNEIHLQANKNEAGQIIDNFATSPLFQLLQTNNPASLGMMKDFNRVHLNKLLGGNLELQVYFAEKYNIDPYWYLDSISKANYASFNRYYLNRSKEILDYIYSQDYPKAAQRHAHSLWASDKKITLNSGEQKALPAKLYSYVVKELRAIIHSPKDSTAIYTKLIKNTAPKLAEKKSDKRDTAEMQIYHALNNSIKDNSSLHRFLNKQFLIKNNCLPFLCGLKSPGSALEKISKDKIFDRKLIGTVFRFLGEVGIKNDDDMVLDEKNSHKI